MSTTRRRKECALMSSFAVGLTRAFNLRLVRESGQNSTVKGRQSSALKIEIFFNLKSTELSLFPKVQGQLNKVLNDKSLYLTEYFVQLLTH